MRAAIPLALALAACSAQPETSAASDPPDPVVTIALPTDEPRLPATAAGELVTNTCTACHSAEMIRQQPKLDAGKWAATVKKMREAYHAEIAPADDAALVKALVELQGA